MKQTFLIFTHTAWSEAPRLRHQVAHLLVEHGHRVFFFERGGPYGSRGEPAQAQVENGPTLVRTHRLLHYQLRVLPPLHWANAQVVGGQIAAFARRHDLGDDVVIINFNFDFYFLRKIFPRNRIITIINDDFEAMCRLPYHGHMTWALERTCRMSDEVLTVSTPLMERLIHWCKPRLFLPWSVAPYQAPTGSVSDRNMLLFWGYVDKRLDLDLICRMADVLARERPDFKILIVGPSQESSREMVERRVAPHANIEVTGRRDLDELPVSRILAAIIPYRRDRPSDAALLPNKTMQLLARGWPLIIGGMPAFMRKPYIRRVDAGADIGRTIDECVANFDAWQPEIRSFVEENPPESRLPMLGAAGLEAPVR